MPEVDAIYVSAYTGAVGDPILIQAHDDVEVTAVSVTLFDGAELESGPATLYEWHWRYGVQADVPRGTDITITAAAMDRLGNGGEVFFEIRTP